MSVDALTGEVETVLERVQAESDRQITAAKKIVDGLNIEKQKAQAALAQLADQKKQAQTELDAVMNNLGRASSLATLSSEITKAKAELKKLQDETAKASTTLEGLVTQRRAAEAQTAALRIEASQWAAARSETEAAIKRLRERFA